LTNQEAGVPNNYSIGFIYSIYLNPNPVYPWVWGCFSGNAAFSLSDRRSVRYASGSFVQHNDRSDYRRGELAKD
jgi:hypothetical protein